MKRDPYYLALIEACAVDKEAALKELDRPDGVIEVDPRKLRVFCRQVVRAAA